MIKLSLILTLFSLTYTGISQIVFQKELMYYSTSAYGSLTKDIQITNDGGSVLLRNDVDFNFNQGCIRIVKANYLGNIEWTANFYSNVTGDPGSRTLYGITIKQTNDSGYIILGQNSLNGLDKDILLIKIDSGGNIQWNKYYSTPTPGSLVDDICTDIIQTSDDGYLITGALNDLNPKLCLLKTNSLGSIMWQKNLSIWSFQSIIGFSIKETIDGGFFITCKAGGSVPLLIKTDSSGTVTWAKTYSYLQNMNLIYGEITMDGGYIVSINTGNTYAGYLLKVKADGEVEWFKNYKTEFASRVKQTSDNGYIICGGSYNLAANTYAGTILKTDSLGNVAFLKTIYGLRSIFHSVKQTLDHGFVIAGDKLSISNSASMLFLKTDSLGFSGCNDILVNLPIYQYSLAATPQIVTSTIASYTVATLSITNIISFDTITTDLCNAQSVREINNQNSLKIFPNPTKGEFIIQTNENSKNSKLKLINIIGETILEKEITLNEENVNILNQPNGIYFLELNQLGNTSRIKIIKE